MARIPSSVLRQTGVIRRHHGRGSLGAPNLGTPIAVRTRVERRSRVLKRTDGTEVTQVAVAFVRPDIDVAAEDEFCEDSRPLATVQALIDAQGSAFKADGRSYTVEDVADAQGLTRSTHRELVLT